MLFNTFNKWFTNCAVYNRLYLFSDMRSDGLLDNWLLGYQRRCSGGDCLKGVPFIVLHLRHLNHPMNNGLVLYILLHQHRCQGFEFTNLLDIILIYQGLGCLSLGGLSLNLGSGKALVESVLC